MLIIHAANLNQTAVIDALVESSLYIRLDVLRVDGEIVQNILNNVHHARARFFVQMDKGRFHHLPIPHFLVRLHPTPQLKVKREKKERHG